MSTTTSTRARRRAPACDTRSRAGRWYTTGVRSRPSPGTVASSRGRSGPPYRSPRDGTKARSAGGHRRPRRARNQERRAVRGGETARPVAGVEDHFMIVGSHIDAVPNGGWLDGALGLMTALETVRQLSRAGTTPPIGVRFVDWADEEGARFGRSLLGSSACAGTLDPDEVRDLRDAEGVTLVDALASCGVDLDTASDAAERLKDAVAYLELHIEQGPVLLDGGRLACAVSGTVGVERHLMTFTGQAAHAGSTPMRLRQDSLAAAARAALEIRESAIAHGGVGTVGKMESTPGLITAVAARTEMQLDQRHLDPDALAAMFSEAVESCRSAAEAFNCTFEVRDIFKATPTPFHPELVKLAQEAIAAAGGGEGDPVPSGPLHD